MDGRFASMSVGYANTSGIVYPLHLRRTYTHPIYKVLM